MCEALNREIHLCERIIKNYYGEIINDNISGYVFPGSGLTISASHRGTHKIFVGFSYGPLS